MYLHTLTHQSFIHQDLELSNILLGNDFRAKVLDFGKVKLAPDGEKSVITWEAGMFGCLAPENASNYPFQFIYHERDNMGELEALTFAQNSLTCFLFFANSHHLISFTCYS
ncbi:putative protein kinase RLK-Pelle-LRR-IX family [Helianthus anomalus]